MSDIFNKDQKWPAFGQPYFDPRLTQGLATLFEYPTLVQHQAIPALCRGRNLLMKAKTGSGKTVAYLAPAIQRCLSDARKKPMMVCILVPSRELVAQCVEVANSLLRFCFEDLEVDSCVGTDFKRVKAEIFVSTPTTLLKYIQYMEGRSKTRFNPGMIVIDEADLLFSYGFQKDLTTLIQSYFPKTYQAVLVSATLSANVEALRGIFLHKEVVIRVSDPKNEEAPAEVIQQMVRVFPDRVDSDSCFINKMATLFYLLRVDTSWMKHGKNALIFVSNVEKAYQVKLFLEQFREKVGIIHQEMSSAARLRSIKAFNQKVTRILVATDQVLESDEKLQLLEADSDEAQEFGLEVHEFGAEEPEMVEMAAPEQPDIDYVAHRGLDFQGVALVLNFDLPKSFKSYIHRIGRTGRGGATGVAISLVAVGDDECLSNFSRIMAGVDGEIQEHEVPQANVNRFMYRIEDACARLHKSQLKDYRVKELQNEALTSQELEEHFKNRPEDREALEKRLSDMQKRTRGRAKHSTFLPTYLLPPEHLLATTGVQRAIQTQMKADGEALQSVVGSKLESYYQRQRKAKSGFTEEKPAESSRYTREKMIRRSKNASCVDELQPLSNRKLWKLNHSRKIRKTHFEAIPFKIKKKDPLKFRPKKQAAKPKK